VSQRAHIGTTLPRTSQPRRGAWLLLALAASELEPWSSPSIPTPKGRFFAWRGAENDVGHRKLWSTHSLLLQSVQWQATRYSSPAVRLHRHPEHRRFLQSVSIEHHLSRIFPAHPRSLASVLIPRPSALDVLLRFHRPAGFGFQKIFSAISAKNAEGKDFPNLPKKHAFGTRERGTLASLRARVSRGQSGQIQTGEKQWHSTKTISS
jgi:hypothetical protein